jgi:hypothetical protein
MKRNDFNNVLKHLGFTVYNNCDQFKHPALGNDLIIDLSAMADVSTVIKKVFEYGKVVGRNEKVEEIVKVLKVEELPWYV